MFIVKAGKRYISRADSARIVRVVSITKDELAKPSHTIVHAQDEKFNLPTYTTIDSFRKEFRLAR